jgi:hypothetical protein
MPATHLWERVALDLITNMPRSRAGNTVVAVFSEAFSKFKWAAALPDKTAIGVAKAYLEKIVLAYGAPEKLLTDQGKEFLNELMKEVNNILGVQKINTSTYHPQTDGEVERFNSTLKEQLRAACGVDQTNWDLHLPYIVSAYNATPHASTGETPFYLMHGRDFMLPKDWSTAAPATRKGAEKMEERRAIIRRLQHMHQKIRTNLQATATKMKEWYDKKVAKGVQVEEGQLVLLRNERKPEAGQSAQLLPLWEGPFRVEKQTGPVTFRLVHLSNSNRRELAHVDRLKPFVGRGETQPLEHGIHEVEDIIDMKREGSTNKYLVRWKGFTARHDTWEPESNLAKAQDLLRRFNDMRKQSGTDDKGEENESNEEDEDEDEDEDATDEDEDEDATVEYPPESPEPNRVPEPRLVAQPPRSSGRAGRAPPYLGDFIRH